MSEFGGKADVQQIRVIALVTITVLPEPANSGPTQTSNEGQLCNFGHSAPNKNPAEAG
jgi:hypothetical protein